MIKTMLTLAVVVTLTVSVTKISAQSFGQYAFTQSVVSNGGGNRGGNFAVTGSSAQPLAGTVSSSGQFAVRGGFWQGSFAPTPALVSVSGKVLTAMGGGISRGRVTLTDGSGDRRSALTGPFGYFRFDDVEVGQTYIISIRHKRFQFGSETQVMFVGDEITDIIFNALPESIF